MTIIAGLTTESFRLHLFFKVIELLVTIETIHEQSTKIYEYLVGDETGCVILNTKQELKMESMYEMKNGHTQTVDGFLRLYSNELQEVNNDSIKTVDTQNNRSYVFLERKAS